MLSDTGAGIDNFAMPVSMGGTAIGGSVNESNSHGADDWFNIINNAAINWYGVLTNRTNPNGAAVDVSLSPAGGRVSLSPAVMLLGIGIVALVVLSKK